ncbi:MAG: haloalkane dehalogenase [Roseiflexaceae bacterium]
MQVLRTPDERFADLPEYPFAPHYADLGGLRMHYVDEGPHEAAPVLLLHGEPTWSYLYRRMIGPLVASGHRVIAPDLIGFGRSDKPARQEDYSYQQHVEWLAGLLVALDLRRITLFCQDWGGLIGLRVLAEHSERFARAIAANTALPDSGQRGSRAVRTWQTFARFSPWFPIGRIVQAGCVTRLAPTVRTAYDAPFPDRRYKAGARAFPRLIPSSPDDPALPANRRAWEQLARWDKPFLTAFSDQDPITRGADRPMRERIPGARGQPHTTIQGAGHFLQEDRGPELAVLIDGFIKRNT